jgi:anaerobic selenocysteine-containing dehydrogenase
MSERRINGFCALCRSRCGCISVVRDGRLVAVEPWPEHPTGESLCAKGRAAPELVHHPDRLLQVEVETPAGRARARVQLNRSLDPRVVCGQHGWWQACAALGLPGFDPFSPEGANYNGLIDARAVDPVSGAPPHRAFICEVRRVSRGSAA